MPSTLFAATDEVSFMVSDAPVLKPSWWMPTSVLWLTIDEPLSVRVPLL